MKFLPKIFRPKKSKEPEDLLAQIKRLPIPVHIGIIMDGNGRWANKRGLPRTAGHRAGMESLKSTVKACIQAGVKYLTVYAFSTENWKRPKDEVDALMGLLVEYINKELNELNSNGVRVKAIGDLAKLPESAKRQVAQAEAVTAANSKLNLQIALNYGGRREITEAVREIAAQAAAGRLNPADINEELINNYLYTAGLPDPDLIIRPSGELRISNFLIWQSAYAEFVVTDILWPDFTPAHLYEAIAEYQQRHRRFGGL